MTRVRAAGRALLLLLVWPIRTVQRLLTLGWLIACAVVGGAVQAAADGDGLINGPDLGGADTVFERIPLTSYTLPFGLSDSETGFPYVKEVMWEAFRGIGNVLMYLTLAVVKGAITCMQWMLNLTIYRDNSGEIDRAVQSLAGAVFWPMLAVTVAIAAASAYGRMKQHGGGSIFNDALWMITATTIAVTFAVAPSKVAGTLDDVRTSLSGAITQGYTGSASADSVAGSPDTPTGSGKDGATRALSNAMWNVYAVAPWCWAAFGSLDVCKDVGHDYLEDTTRWKDLYNAQRGMNGDGDDTDSAKCPDEYQSQCTWVRGQSFGRLGGALFAALIGIPLAVMLMVLVVFGIMAIVGLVMLTLIGLLFLLLWMIPGRPAGDRCPLVRGPPRVPAAGRPDHRTARRGDGDGRDLQRDAAYLRAVHGRAAQRGRADHGVQDPRDVREHDRPGLAGQLAHRLRLHGRQAAGFGGRRSQETRCRHHQGRRRNRRGGGEDRHEGRPGRHQPDPQPQLGDFEGDPRGGGGAQGRAGSGLPIRHAGAEPETHRARHPVPDCTRWDTPAGQRGSRTATGPGGVRTGGTGQPADHVRAGHRQRRPSLDRWQQRCSSVGVAGRGVVDHDGQPANQEGRPPDLHRRIRYTGRGVVGAAADRPALSPQRADTTGDRPPDDRHRVRDQPVHRDQVPGAYHPAHPDRPGHPVFTPALTGTPGHRAGASGEVDMTNPENNINGHDIGLANTDPDHPSTGDDGFYAPWVPPRTTPTRDDTDDQWWDELPRREELRIRPAPDGANRRDQKAHQVAEAQRIADLQARAPSAGALKAAGLPYGPPKGLTRKGKRAWRAENRDIAAARRQRVLSSSVDARAAGALIVGAVIAVLLLLRVFVFGGADSPVSDPGTPASASPRTTLAAAAPTRSSTAATPPIAAAAAAPPVAALAAVQTWLALTCESSVDYPNAARWQAAKPLLTDAGFASANLAPTVVPATWACSGITVTGDPAATPDGSYLVDYTATRTITTGSSPTVTEQVTGTRVVVPQNGQWLVDREMIGHTH